MLPFRDFRLFYRHLLLAFIYHGILKLPVSGILVPSRVQNFRARYDHPTDAIYIQWSYPEEVQREAQPKFLVRYRITNRSDGSSEFDWRYTQSGSELEARLDLDEVRNGDELQAQVRAERPDGTVLEDWSQSLLISITKRVLIDGIPTDDDDLLPPLDFQAHILSTSMVRLDWTPAVRALSNVPLNNYYVVNVKQLTSDDQTPLLRQQLKNYAIKQKYICPRAGIPESIVKILELDNYVKVQTNSFTLNNLKPGQRYELTIRTASSPERVSNTAAIVEIIMPREDEYFEVGNLIITSHFKGTGQGTVNLSWEVPEKMQNQIQAYELEYKENGTDNWHQLHFSGLHPSATLTTLKSDTEYLLKIRTHLYNNLTTESGYFRFRTPAIIPNPIKKVDVIYTHESDGTRLQWTLENFLPADLVDGYDIYISDDPDIPDAEWSYYSITGSEVSNDALINGANSLTLRDLQAGHTYYVRINVRKKNGEVLRAPSIYRFKTMERTEFLERREGNALSYRLLSPGRAQITWAYPSSLVPSITGSSIMYAESNVLMTEQWERIDLADPRQNFVILEQLRPNSRYFIRILPQINNTFYDNSVIDMFEIRTGPESHMRSSTENAVPQMPQQLRNNLIRKDEKLVLSACNPDMTKNECSWDERCVPIQENRFRGWCIPGSLRNAIINN
uniref:Fibronectin type-III domain-containing protein n=1 Tax=Setaria digitata TaxID=48799 RepID=A0A915PVE8_9BILA